MIGSSTRFGYFWVRRLHSLSGLVLSAAFVLCFLIPYSSALGGPESFNRFIVSCRRIPLLDAIEVAFVLLPLVFHAAAGLSIVYGSQFNVVAYGSYRNWMYALQRITGILMIPFLVYHIYETRISFAFTGRFADYAFMQRLFAHTWVKIIYGAGVASAAFHIGNGISTALVRWGITASRRAQDAAAMIMWVVTFVIAIWGARIIMTF